MKHPHSKETNNDNIVSVVVDRTVLSGKVKEFESHIKSIIQVAKGFSGYLGADIINPDNGNRYIVVFRFASQTELNTWSVSKERRYWVNKIDEVIEKPPESIAVTGMETWFYLTKTDKFVPPAKYKMAIVTYLAIAPIIMFFNVFLGTFFSSIVPQPFTIFISAPFVVLLMTYLVMPMMTKIFSFFLFPVSRS